MTLSETLRSEALALVKYHVERAAHFAAYRATTTDPTRAAILSTIINNHLDLAAANKARAEQPA